MFSPNVRAMPTEQVLHIIGGGLAGSEAAWQAAEPACPSCCTRCGPCAAPTRTRPTAWPSWSAPTPSAPTTGRTTPSACCTRRCAARLADHARGRRAPDCRPAARWRSTATAFRAAVTARAGRPSADRASRARKSPACRRPDWDSVIVATGPLTSPALAEAIRALHRRGRALLLRRHRADRASETHRYGHRLDAVALRQGGPAATAPTTSTARWTKAQYDAFIDALLAGEKTEFKEWEKATPYFEGCLPIEVMAARGRETLRFGPMKPVGPDRSAHRPRGPMRWCSCARTTRWARCGTWWLPDQAEARRADAHLPHDPRAGEGRVRAAGRAAPQHLHQLAAPARRRNCG